MEVTVGGVGIPRYRQELELILTDEDVHRVKTGYVCVYCLEPFQEAWPEKCNVCSFPVRARQAEWFSNSYNGKDPPLRSTEDILLEFDHEDAEKVHVPGSQILLPKGIRAS